MANGKKRKHNALILVPGGKRNAKAARRNGHKRNPVLRRTNRRHRNPELFGFDVMSVVKLSGGAAVGAVFTRWLPEQIMAEANVGFPGYLANLATALGAGWAVGKFGNKEIGGGIVAGGVAATIIRAYDDMTGNSGNALAGLSDIGYSGNLGRFMPMNYPIPVDQGGPYLVQPVPQLPAAPAGAGTPLTAAKSGMSVKGNTLPARMRKAW
jgi:hypothetical protein